MTLQEIMRLVEGHEFAARLNLASDMRTLLSIALQQDEIRRLIELLEKPEAQEEVLRRVVQISRQRIDPRYENPGDAALAVYVWVLNVRGSRLARLAADAAIEAPHCWWAEKIVQQVGSTGRVPSENYTQPAESGFQIVRNAGSDDTCTTLPFFASLIAKSARVQFPEMQSQGPPAAHANQFTGGYAAEVRLTNVGSGEQRLWRRAA